MIEVGWAGWGGWEGGEGRGGVWCGCVGVEREGMKKGNKKHVC